MHEGAAASVVAAGGSNKIWGGVVVECLHDCDACIDNACDGCEYGHDKAACEIGQITYFDATERGL